MSEKARLPLSASTVFQNDGVSLTLPPLNMGGILKSIYIVIGSSTTKNAFVYSKYLLTTPSNPACGHIRHLTSPPTTARIRHILTICFFSFILPAYGHVPR